MNAEDAKDVALFYDKYAFKQGCMLCDEVIQDYFGSLEDMERSLTLDLDMVIDLTVICHEANIRLAFEKGILYLAHKMTEFRIPPGHPYGNVMFEVKHLKKIFPLLRHAPLDPYTHDMINYMMSAQSVETLEDIIDRPRVEKEFYSYCQYQHTENLLLMCISRIELTGTGVDADGPYSRDSVNDPFKKFGNPPISWGGQWVKFEIRRSFNGKQNRWAILRVELTQLLLPDDVDKEYKLCWWAPYSGSMLPPLAGWVPVDPMARSNPRIKYCLKSSIGYLAMLGVL